MFKWLFYIFLFATCSGKYQNKEKPLKRQGKLGLGRRLLLAPVHVPGKWVSNHPGYTDVAVFVRMNKAEIEKFMKILPIKLMIKIRHIILKEFILAAIRFQDCYTFFVSSRVVFQCDTYWLSQRKRQVRQVVDFTKVCFIISSKSNI